MSGSLCPTVRGVSSGRTPQAPSALVRLWVVCCAEKSNVLCRSTLRSSSTILNSENIHCVRLFALLWRRHICNGRGALGRSLQRCKLFHFAALHLLYSRRTPLAQV